mgnify:CR=1 FL=1
MKCLIQNFHLAHIFKLLEYQPFDFWDLWFLGMILLTLKPLNYRMQLGLDLSILLSFGHHYNVNVFNLGVRPRFLKARFLLPERKLRKYSNRVHRTTGHFYIFSRFHNPYSTNQTVSTELPLHLKYTERYPVFLSWIFTLQNFVMR